MLRGRSFCIVHASAKYRCTTRTRFLARSNRLDVGNQHAGAAQHFPKRLNYVGDSHVARGDFEACGGGE
jgi:hypothetical protein